MMFIYNARNHDKKIHLITRHEFDILATLDRLGIHSNLFDTISVIAKHEKKADFIRHRTSIFIDNAFSERQSVSKQCGIPVFDVDAISLVNNWKV